MEPAEAAPAPQPFFEKWFGSCKLQCDMGRFFIPLAIQAASQSLTYPLVASIISHGRLGTLEFAAFAQGQALMFLLGALGSGSITTGMVFARSRTGFLNYSRLVSILTITTAVLQILCCIPPLDRFMFGRVLGLSGEAMIVARNTMFLCVPMQVFFYIRGISLATLFIEKQSGKANLATLCRIGATALCCPLFGWMGLSGYFWGAVAMTLGVWLELAMTKHYAKPYMEKLTDAPELEKASTARQLHYMIPLSFGGMMLSATGFMIAIFLSKAPQPEIALPIHYILMGFINPLGFAALRMQTVTICFPPESVGLRPMQSFAIWVGGLLCMVSFLMQIPSVADWYFGEVQNLPREQVKMAMLAALFVAPFPLVQALRGHAEGLAAVRRRPNAILASQAIFLTVLVLTLGAQVTHPVIPGYLMGATSLLAANFMSFVTLRIALIANDLADQYHVSVHVHERYSPTGTRF